MRLKDEVTLVKTVRMIDKLLQMYNAQIYMLIRIRKGLEQRAFKEHIGHKIPKHPGL